MPSYLFSSDDELLLDLALREDFGPKGDRGGDATTQATVPDEVLGSAGIVAKEELVVCGLEVASRVFEKLDSRLEWRSLTKDGQRVPAGTILATIRGSFSAILSGERLALNFLQHLSGISTQTSDLVRLIQGERTKILDTRKTLPGHRRLEKYAVAVGGGVNHRIGLYDAFLIKNNHIDILGGDVARAIRLCREKEPLGMKVQVEVRDMAELAKAILERPDAVLLDNMNPSQIIEALGFLEQKGLRSSIQTEASGGIQRDNILSYARTGVDFVSLGALTHSVKACDISLRFQKEPS